MTPSSLHADALRVLREWRAPDAEQERLRASYVAHLEVHPDGTTRACRPAHLTASTLVLSGDGEQVLLTLHAKARQWFQMGGHCDPGDQTLAEAARREAVEESGVADLRLDPEPVHLDAHPVTFCGGRDAVHLDVRFLAVAPPAARTAISEESLDVRWWPADALPGDEPSLRALVALARDRFRRFSPARAPG